MTVEGLIEKLQKLNPNTQVVLQDGGPFVRLMTEDDVRVYKAAKSKSDETSAILTFDNFYKNNSDEFGEPFPVLLFW